MKRRLANFIFGWCLSGQHNEKCWTILADGTECACSCHEEESEISKWIKSKRYS